MLVTQPIHPLPHPLHRSFPNFLIASKRGAEPIGQPVPHGELAVPRPVEPVERTIPGPVPHPLSQLNPAPGPVQRTAASACGSLEGSFNDPHPIRGHPVTIQVG
jgi:hypothetical protein